MGYAGVFNFGGLRIGGLSGIYKSNDFYKGHFEIAPYNQSSAHSVYHVRNLEVFRLSQLKQPLDIMFTHDWPTGIYNHGNCDELLKFKPYFAEEMRTNTLGSPVNEQLLKILKPKYWFSAHLHVKFACNYKHSVNDPSSTQITKFLALDKCLPRRRFLQVIEIEPSRVKTNQIRLDPEWLCVLKKTDHLLSVETYNQAPISQKENIVISDEDLENVCEDFEGMLEVPDNFAHTAPAFNTDQSKTILE